MNKLKKLLLTVLIGHSVMSASAQTYTNMYDAKLTKLATKWMKNGEWRNGFTKASPSDKVNAVEFYLQYQKNAEEWNAMFKWLQETDLLAIKGGKTPIPGTKLTVSVEDCENWCSEQDLKDGKGSESHEHKIDFMYVVRGLEGFAKIDHDTAKDKTGYMAEKDRHEYEFDAYRLMRFENIEGTFELFFPCDWHIAKVKTNADSQKLRVLVIKVNYKL